MKKWAIEQIARKEVPARYVKRSDIRAQIIVTKPAKAGWSPGPGNILIEHPLPATRQVRKGQEDYSEEKEYSKERTDYLLMRHATRPAGVPRVVSADDFAWKCS